MKLTKKLAVALHRRLWNWIADETERQQRIVRKSEYPLFQRLAIKHDCWCCEYAKTARKNDIFKKAGDDNNKKKDMLSSIFICAYCPIKMRNQCGHGSEYSQWFNATTWQKAAHWARIIAQLPEREEETE